MTPSRGGGGVSGVCETFFYAILNKQKCVRWGWGVFSTQNCVIWYLNVPLGSIKGSIVHLVILIGRIGSKDPHILLILKKWRSEKTIQDGRQIQDGRYLCV